MGYHNPHRTFGSKVHWRLQSRLAFHYSRLSGLHRSSYQLPWKASCASRTKSMTSSVALTLKRSQYQSTHMSAGNIVSNMKSWSSWRVLVICVLFMMVYLHRSGPIAIQSVPPCQLVGRLKFSIKKSSWEWKHLPLTNTNSCDGRETVTGAIDYYSVLL